MSKENNPAILKMIRFAICLLSLVVNITAYVIPQVDPAQGLTRLDDDEIANLRRCISYAAVTYCENNNDLKNWNCGKHCNNTPGTEFVQAFSASRSFCK